MLDDVPLHSTVAASPGPGSVWNGTDAVGTDAGSIARLRADLSAAGFTVAGVDALWGEEAAAALFRGHRVAARRSAADGVARHDALAVLATVFVLGLAVDREALASALPSLGVGGALRLGLVAIERGAAGSATARPLVDLRPYSFSDAAGSGSWWICSDLGELALGRTLREDHVLGVGGASNTLSAIMIRERVATALDLGTGCGIQAMHAARHADHVVATDVSRRALRFADFNTRLNGMTNVELRQGSMFDPVADERFDRIVSNPPFVITPRSPGVPEYDYRDGGMTGDVIVEAVVRGARRHLNPGGVAQLLGNWEYRGGGEAFDRVLTWLGDEREPGALDAWVVERELQDAPQYAETWVRDGGTRPGTREFERLMDAWLDDFAARDVRYVGFGYLTLRRPVDDVVTLRRLESVASSSSADGGLWPHLARGLRMGEWLASVDDEQLGLARLSTAGDVTEERHYRPGAEDPTLLSLTQGGGFGRRIGLDTALAAFVGACDGDLPVGVIVGALADLLDVDAAALAADLLPRVRELVFVGVLEPLGVG
jgi:methylase of polypeptide subunit release factors